MLRTGILLLLGLILASSGQASPEKGGRSNFQRISPTSAYEQTLVFRGGERACVIAKGKRTESGNDAEGALSIEVKDVGGRVVVSDRDHGGYAVVFWYPPRDDEYRVFVHNSSAREQEIYISIK